MVGFRMSGLITLTIDPGFQALIPPLQEDERAPLEANLEDNLFGSSVRKRLENLPR